MKQARIEYKITGDDKILFVGFKNVLNIGDISKILSKGNYSKWIYGRAFYALIDQKVIRLYSFKDFNADDKNDMALHYKDYPVGKEYSMKEWWWFIWFLKESGREFSKIHRDQERTKTILI
jgi:hypothetical protein